MSFDLNSTFTDGNLERDGVWIEYFEGSQLKIASKESPEYKAYLARLAQRHKLKIGGKPRPETMSLMKTVMSDAMAKHLLLDWKGISLNGEEEVPYSYATGKMVLLNSIELYEFVDNAAEDHAQFRIEQEEEVKKP
jgi:hypothetical protein